MAASRPPSGGYSVVRGAALQALRDAEARAAREALERHHLDHEAVLLGASWLGSAAVRRRRSGHGAVAKEFADLLRLAVELLMKDGLELDAVKGRMPEGRHLLDALFPSWVASQRSRLHVQLGSVAPAFARWSDAVLPHLDANLIDEFVAWLEANVLLGAHMSVGALMDYGHRPDTDADVGVAFHVASLASWVEHVCNALLGASLSPRDTLEQKLPRCWDAHPQAAAFRSHWGRMSVPSGTTAFPDKVGHVLGFAAGDRIAWMARDARLAQVIRNEGLHAGLRSLDRAEAHEAANVLLRVGVGAWMVRR